jgi:C1A family cysteine protease
MGNFQSNSEQPRFPLKIRNVKRYGCIPDIPDQRDIWTTFPKTIEYYQTTDLRRTNFLPEISNQGELGSSVAHAILAAYIYCLKKESNYNDIDLSPQFIYYNQRLIAGTTESDSGSSIRDGIKVLERLGVCNEETYPYDLISFRDRPTDESYEFAYKNKHSIQYRRVRLLLEDIMKSISIKIPILMGFTVYDSFQHPDVTRTGVMPVPKPGEKIVGHHVTLIIGYDISKKYLLCRNSWGSTWGQGGYFWMPFPFVNSRNCSDLWIISTSTGSKPLIQSVVQKRTEKPVEKIIEKVPEFKEEDNVSENEIEEDDTIV